MLEKLNNYQLKHKNLKLIPITTENYWEIGWLELKKEQEEFVGDNFKLGLFTKTLLANPRGIGLLP